MLSINTNFIFQGPNDPLFRFSRRAMQAIRFVCGKNIFTCLTVKLWFIERRFKILYSELSVRIEFLFYKMLLLQCVMSFVGRSTNFGMVVA